MRSAVAAPRAKVFISCGQHSPSERRAAGNIAGMLTELGFDPYVATQEQTLKGLRENIFRNLEDSGYFIFVDFKREQLANLQDCRGSLFSHQELALASYLDLDVIAFQEEGVRHEDGLMRFLQANSIPFSEPGDLPRLIRRRIEEAGWVTGWKNGLELSIGDPAHVDTHPPGAAASEYRRFFHLSVVNHHWRLPALNCSAVVESILNAQTNLPIAFGTVELHWAGSSEQFIMISPRHQRELDLGFDQRFQDIFYFNSFSTSTQYMGPLRGPGHFIVAYTVSSANFRPRSFSVEIEITDHEDAKMDHIQIRPSKTS